jgi:hypothetical protein
MIEGTVYFLLKNGMEEAEWKWNMQVNLVYTSTRAHTHTHTQIFGSLFSADCDDQASWVINNLKVNLHTVHSVLA